MFENLSDKLQRAFKDLRGQGTLTEENINDALRQIRTALLEADVNLAIAREVVDHIKAKALGAEVATALSPAEQIVKIVRDELMDVLGHDTAKFKFAPQPPTVILMAGLQGSGKTTTTGKLAAWLKKGGHRPLLVSVDVYRPAAREQLKVVADSIKAQIYIGKLDPASSPSDVSSRRSAAKPRDLLLPPPIPREPTAPPTSSASPKRPTAKPATSATTSSSSTPPAASASTKPSWTRWPSSKPSSTPPRSSSSPTP